MQDARCVHKHIFMFGMQNHFQTRQHNIHKSLLIQLMFSLPAQNSQLLYITQQIVTRY
jgi:hypothetical protein